ncbi:PaaI family thioesterase [Crossiella sp. CA-258035]|uniref:PaaI family thioesterase n=1 Tax=Crossiella sp. CA-258035 TaxID=2981138 RepID=UPI0024BCF7C3|nr:PaaI family thioesterase [Crossiella sp. CA-258035]WHT16112.1 PaaI family thioesterase [Crossiella sp. CA-258035]
MGDNEFGTLWAQLTGEQMLVAMADGRARMPRHAEPIGLSLREVVRGRVSLRWKPSEEACNSAGQVHGGYLAMVLDDAGAMACVTLADRYRPMLTMSLHIDYLRPVLAGAEYVATGVVVHPGQRRMLADAEITDAQGRRVARASGSFTPNLSYDGNGQPSS